MSTYRVCFVCLGNICRSPMAEVVLRERLVAEGLGDRVLVSSAGTGDWHVGQPADQRTVATLADRGWDASGHRARQFSRADFANLDLVLALDRNNLAVLRGLAAPHEAEKVRLLMSFAGVHGVLDVPDPYYDGEEGFADALRLIELACEGLVEHVRRELGA